LGDTKTIRPFALKGHGSIAHSASPHGLLTCSPCGLRVKLLNSAGPAALEAEPHTHTGKKRKPMNRPYSCSRYWAGTGLQLRLMQGVFSIANDINLFLMIFPRMSLHCRLVPVRYREYEYDLLIFLWLSWLAVLLVGAYTRRRRRSRPRWMRPYSS